MRTDSTAPTRSTVRAVAAALAADVVAILVFVAVGRHNHAEGVTVAGVAQTAAPFLTGLAAAWLLVRAWRSPAQAWPTGVQVWLSTVVVGMGLRAALGGGIAISFIVVATLTTGLLMLGWRVLAAVRPKGRAAVRARRR